MDRGGRPRSRLTRGAFLAGLLATAGLALVAAAGAMLVGGVAISPTELFAGAGSSRTILLQLRLPRVLLSGLVGGALAVSGAALQPMLRNPLASPDIIGVSGGAALAAVLSLAILGGAGAGSTMVPLVAFGGAALSTALVYRLSLVHGRLEPVTQVLVGVIFNTFAASLILLVSAVVDLSRSHSIVFWLMGGIAIYPPSVLVLVAVLVAAGGLVLVRAAPALNLMSLGDEPAEHLGVDLAAVRRRVFGASALLVGAVVSLTGVITFVGLIVPHVLRRLLGGDNRLLVPASFFGGAAFLVFCDALARFAIAPAELPVGAITALTGGPFFIYLLRRGRRRELGL